MRKIISTAYAYAILRHDYISFKLDVGKEEMQSKIENEYAWGKRTIYVSNCFLLPMPLVLSVNG